MQNAVLSIGPLAVVALKTSIVYWSILLGLKLVGRRALGQMGPHEFIMIALLAKIMGDKIISDELGFTANIIAGATLFVHLIVIDKCASIRRWVQGSPIQLLTDGVPDAHALRENNICIADLERTARTYGYGTISAFDSMILEPGGKLSGVIHPNNPQNVELKRI